MASGGGSNDWLSAPLGLAACDPSGDGSHFSARGPPRRRTTITSDAEELSVSYADGDARDGAPLQFAAVLAVIAAESAARGGPPADGPPEPQRTSALPGGDWFDSWARDGDDELLAASDDASRLGGLAAEAAGVDDAASAGAERGADAAARAQQRACWANGVHASAEEARRAAEGLELYRITERTEGSADPLSRAGSSEIGASVWGRRLGASTPHAADGADAASPPQPKAGSLMPRQGSSGRSLSDWRTLASLDEARADGDEAEQATGGAASLQRPAAAAEQGEQGVVDRLATGVERWRPS